MTIQKFDPWSKIQSFIKHIYCPYLILSAIFIFQVILDSYYILTDTRVLAWDQSVHLSLSLTYYKLITAGKLLEIIGLSGYYPPFFHLSTVPLYIFGISEDISIAVNFVYLGILLLSIYGIGCIMFDKKSGLLAAFLISCYPFIIMYRRDYMLEFALISLISLSLFLLLKTDNFNNRKFSILFGIALAFSVLIKWTGLIFLLVPMIFVLTKNFKKCADCDKPSIELYTGLKGFRSKIHMDKNKKSDKRPVSGSFTNFIIALIVAFVIAGIWYLPNLREVFDNLIFFAGGRTSQPGVFENDPVVASIQSLLYYSSAAYNQMYIFFAILLVVGFLFLFLDKTMRDKALFFALSILFPYLFFTLVKNKDIRYIAPLLIFFAVISAFWVFRIDKRVQKIIVLLIAVLCVVQVSALTFGFPRSDDELFPSMAPKNENWMVSEAIIAIGESLPRNATHQIVVVVLPDNSRVNGRTYEYYARLSNLPCIVENGAYIPIPLYEQYLPNFDYIVYKTGKLERGPYYKTVQELYRLFETKKDNFVAIAEFPLPDGSTLIIYKNRKI